MWVQISSQQKNFFQDVKNDQWITQELHYNCLTSSLVILYKYLFVHDFVHLAHNFIHILTKLHCFGRAFTLSLLFKSEFAQLATRDSYIVMRFYCLLQIK